MGYSRLFGSLYPDQQLSLQEKKDVDDNVVAQINQIQTYLKSGSISSAKKVYDENKDILEAYNIDASFINLLQEEIYNVGLLALSKQTHLIQSEMPTTQESGYWYLDYE